MAKDTTPRGLLSDDEQLRAEVSDLLRKPNKYTDGGGFIRYELVKRDLSYSGGMDIDSWHAAAREAAIDCCKALNLRLSGGLGESDGQLTDLFTEGAA